MSLGISKSTLDGNQSLPMPALGLLSGLNGVSYDRFNAQSAGAGDIALYTVPVGKRAIVQIEFCNTTSGTINYTIETQLAGSGPFYSLQAIGALTTNVNIGANLGFIFEAGDVVAIHVTASGVNIFGLVILFSNTSKLRTVRVASASWAASTVIYTATQNALMAGSSPLFNSSASASFNYVNQSGNAATIAWSINGLRIFNNSAGTVANNATTGGVFNYYLKPYDAISFATNQTGQQLVWISVWEGV